MRTVTVKLEVMLKMKVDEGVEVSEVINDIEYDFIDNTGKATVEDMEIIDFNVVDC